MKNTLLAVLAIVSSVIGSGFISGKEIVVFFTRFGKWSFLGITLAGILFFVLVRLLLHFGDRVFRRLKNSRFVFLCSMGICLTFSSAMFAAATDILDKNNIFLFAAGFCAILCMCAYVCRFGLSSLDKINFVLVPVMLICLLVCLCSRASAQTGLHAGSNGAMAILYGPMYVAVNIASSCVLIAGLGQKLSKRQKAQAATVAALVLSAILLFANVVLLQNPQALDKDMPLLSLFTSWQSRLMNLVVFFGCISTLFSLVFASSVTMRGLYRSEMLIFSVSLLLPVVISLLGFGFIVTYLYPLCSILGVSLLLFMLLPERRYPLCKHGRFFQRKKF